MRTRHQSLLTLSRPRTSSNSLFSSCRAQMNSASELLRESFSMEQNDRSNELNPLDCLYLHLQLARPRLNKLCDGDKKLERASERASCVERVAMRSPAQLELQLQFKWALKCTQMHPPNNIHLDFGLHSLKQELTRGTKVNAKCSL